MFRPGFLLALCVLLVPVVIRAQDAFIQPKTKGGPIVHRTSDFAFPARIGRFQRAEPHQFDAAGDDVSVGYNAYEPLVVVTIYVYPVGKNNLEQEFASRQQEIAAGHRGARPATSGDTTVSPSKVKALLAVYEYDDGFAGQVQQLQSLLLVAQHGQQFVEYRISYRVADEKEAGKLARQITQDFAWP